MEQCCIMVYVDLVCSKCELVVVDQWSDREGVRHTCGGQMERLWTLTRGPDPGTHTSERVVVYESLKEGKIQYPGRTDVPIPSRLRARGYERKELNVRDLAKFERKHNVANERRHFDRNGNGF